MAMQRERKVGQAVFYPIVGSETAASVRPRHKTYQCGECGDSTNGRVACDVIREDGAELLMCICSCDKAMPTIVVDHHGTTLAQVPRAREFRSHEKWPVELAKLYDEAAKSHAAGAYTAVSMVCRKILMACACHEGDTDGKNFTQYVDFITGTVLVYPRAKAAIDAIRTIGNEANHQVEFVVADDAKRAMQIVTYMLDAIYSFPSA